MSIISYAQNFEDIMLWRALGHIERGFYVDIGAQDPKIDSVSLLFHERGWRGIHVEPTPHYAELLRQQRPGDTVIQAAVGNGPPLAQFFEIPNTGISTADADIAAQHRQRGFDVHATTVAFVPLSSIFEACLEEVHWLKIDVEGFEKNLLSSWGEASARPWIIVVESTLPLTQIETHEEWESIVINYGYSHVYFDGLNRYYVSHLRPELKAAFITPPNIFDDFVLAKQDSQMKRELEAAHHAHAEKEREMATQLCTAQHQVDHYKEELAHSHKEQEIEFNKQLNLLHQERVIREQTLQEQTKQVHTELEIVLRQQVEREQKFLDQLLDFQLNSEYEKRLKEHGEQIIQARLELEKILKFQVEREQQFAAQLLDAQQQYAKEKIELVRTQREQTIALRHQLLEGERSFSRQLLDAQHALHHQHQKDIDRTQEVTLKLLTLQQKIAEDAGEQTRSNREHERNLYLHHTAREDALHQQLQDRYIEVGNLHKARACREQEIVTQLLAIQQHAEKEMAEHARVVEELHKARCREQEIVTQLLAIQQHAEREMAEHARVVEELHKAHACREQEIGTQLLAIQQHAAKEMAEHTRVVEELHKARTYREQEIVTQLLAIQQHADKEIAEHARLVETCTTLNTQLQEEVQAAHQVSTQLQKSLRDMQRILDTVHGSLIWRLSSYLRKIATSFGIPSNQISIPNVSEKYPYITQETAKVSTPSNLDEVNPVKTAEVAPADLHADKRDEIISKQDISTFMAAPSNSSPSSKIELSISYFAQATAINMSNNVSSLSDLLAFHDEQFIRYAYKTLLGRSPDPNGLSYYLGRLRSGFSKIQILTQLRLSDEGLNYGAELPSLQVAIKNYKKTRYPLIGWIFSRINDVEGNSPVERKLRAIENQIFLLSDENRKCLIKFEEKISSLLQPIIQTSSSTVVAEDATSLVQDEEFPLPHAPNIELDPLQRLSPRARSIYHQLKKNISFS